VASIEELLRYLEQFMTGHLNQPAHAGTQSGAAAGRAPSGFESAGGGAPAGAGAPGGVPGGGIPGGGAGVGPGGMPPGAVPPGGDPDLDPSLDSTLDQGVQHSGVPQPSPELASSSPEQVQQALEQFVELHPELAEYLALGGDPVDLAAALSQLGELPPEAVQGFVPSFAEADPADFGFGGFAGDDGFQTAEFGGLLGGVDDVSSLAGIGDLGDLSTLGGLDPADGSTPLPIGELGELSGDGAASGLFDDGGGFGADPSGGFGGSLSEFSPTLADPGIAAGGVDTDTNFGDPATMEPLSELDSSSAAAIDPGPTFTDDLSDPSHDVGAVAFDDSTDQY
jgi:hypothetical protein